MPRIRLAYWHGSHKPGDEVDVSDDELRDLTRDGRVAEVLQAPAPVPVRGESAVGPEAPAAEGRSRKAR